MTEKDATNANILEGQKLFFEALKHLTTLSTGSILLIVTFVEKLFVEPQWKSLIPITLIAFVLSTIAALVSMLAVSFAVRDANRGRLLFYYGGWTSLYVCYVSFLVAMSCLVGFAVKNFLA